MKLDEHQKADFINYWRGCPMIDSRTKELCYIDAVDRSNNGHNAVGFSYYLRPDSKKMNGEGVPLLSNKTITSNSLEIFDPYFVETGFYQLTSRECFWISRTPERSMRKGMYRDNMDIWGILPLYENQKALEFYNREFIIDDIGRIYYNLLPKAHILNLDAEIQKVQETHKEIEDDYLAKNNKKNFSFALSRNIAIVSTEFDVPVVLYKLNPVGYYVDKKIHLNSRKSIAKETIMEDTKIPIIEYEA